MTEKTKVTVEKGENGETMCYIGTGDMRQLVAEVPTRLVQDTDVVAVLIQPVFVRLVKEGKAHFLVQEPGVPMTAHARTNKSGSVGYGAYGKLLLPSGGRLQVGANLTLVGTAPKKDNPEALIAAIS